MSAESYLSDQNLSALRWGGWAGMLGSFILLFVFGFLAVLVGLDTLDIEAEILRYPDIRAARVIENTLYLAATALWMVHAVTLLISLRRTALAPALAGCVFMGLGLVILATGAIPHTMTDPVADLYHAPGATPEGQAVLVSIWHAIQGIVDTLVITGIALTSVGMGFLSVAMLRSPGYGAWTGTVGILLAVAGTGSAIMSLIDPSDIIAVGVFALIFFQIAAGWKTLRFAGFSAGTA
ncbi:MAG: hypothetical protein HKO95_09120 [Rhodobacteraceae bacterium]|nr:hypothetical protein [Paracoccaceae bacterium]